LIFSSNVHGKYSITIFGTKILDCIIAKNSNHEEQVKLTFWNLLSLNTMKAGNMSVASTTVVPTPGIGDSR
jgi:hypothetical protein